MNHFTIRDIENLSGIKAHTLRIWEQRYNLCCCKRKESLHRYYDNEDLKQILRIAYLYHNGYKISRIANLSCDDLKQLAGTKAGEDQFAIFINQLIEASIDYDQPRFEKVLHNAILHLGFERAVVKVFYPFMEKIGLLWITEHVIPAQEHFSSYLIQKKIIVAIDGLEYNPYSEEPVVLLFTPEGEKHEIPLLFAQYLLKKQHIRFAYMGNDVAIPALQEYCAQRPVTHLYFHLITNLLNVESETYLEELSQKFPDKKIIASGPVWSRVHSMSENTTILRSLDEIMKMPSGLRSTAR